MTTKTALIVDDSKTAQVRLKKLLDVYDVSVEVAFSAEEALASLPRHSPDIIFMDHNMGGMDGFEALKIIKSNPSTAMIPVIMYTSEQGDVYVSQARALGAIDTLSKDTFEDSNLEKLMRLLHIDRLDELAEIGARAPERELDAEHEPSPSSLDETVADIDAYSQQEADSTAYDIDPTHVTDVSQVTALERDHVSAVDQARQELLLNDIECQLALQTGQLKKLQEKFEEMHSEQSEAPPAEPMIAEKKLERQFDQVRFLSKLAIGCVLLCFVIFAISQYRIGQKINDLDGALAFIMQVPAKIASTDNPENLESEDDARILPPLAALADESAALQVEVSSLIDTLSWAMSIDMHYPFNDAPLGEGQVLNVQNLIFRLSENGFAGRVTLYIHVGNYCVENEPETGNLILASRDKSIDDCEFFADLTVDEPIESYETVPYIQFLQSATPISSGDIEISLELAGFNQPTRQYPTPEFTTVEEWNAIAARNNRVTFELNPQ